MRIMHAETILKIAVTAALAAGLAAPGCRSRAPAQRPQAQEEHAPDMTPPPANAAPQFPEGMSWLNTDRPLSLAGLRGKVVLLDFWTYCCINCMHVLPDLARLEAKYRDELVVIGVHSAKFTGEKDLANIRQAILRYNIAHPVVNDADMRIWRSYKVRAWPTLVLIDPTGGIATARSGEGIFDYFDAAIAQLVARAEADGTLNRRPLEIALERESVGDSLLSFPGKVLADEASGRLFIADSNHHRIVVASLAGAVRQVIGSGRAGLDDGPIAEATFNNPQGMALAGQTLYVADTDNHAIRAVDLTDGRVTTIAGAERAAGVGGQAAQATLRSPWDLELVEGELYIAMAGPHQLWRMDLVAKTIAPYAGSGREARIDGPLAEAALAQPSGLTADGQKLYFADSEVSCIRSADLDPAGRVTTLVGGDLFDFGDVDGVGDDARLQHPLGVAYLDGVLYVADTYNNKIKRLIVNERRIETFAGSGAAGLADSDDPTAAAFDEPAGVSIAGGTLFVADTNNHVIRTVDLASGAVGTLTVTNTEVLVAPTAAPSDEFMGERIVMTARTVRPGATVVAVETNLPGNLKLTPGAPSLVTARSGDPAVLRVDGQAGPAEALRQELPVTAGSGETTLTVDLSLFYCDSGRESLCYFKQLRLIVPITVDPAAQDDKIVLHVSPTLAAGL